MKSWIRASRNFHVYTFSCGTRSFSKRKYVTIAKANTIFRFIIFYFVYVSVVFGEYFFSAFSLFFLLSFYITLDLAFHHLSILLQKIYHLLKSFTFHKLFSRVEFPYYLWSTIFSKVMVTGFIRWWREWCKLRCFLEKRRYLVNT